MRGCVSMSYNQSMVSDLAWIGVQISPSSPNILFPCGFMVNIRSHRTSLQRFPCVSSETSYMTLGKLFNIPLPQFPHLKKMHKNDI